MVRLSSKGGRTALLAAIAISFSRISDAGDNREKSVGCDSTNQCTGIVDARWDKTYYSTTGYDKFIKWYYDSRNAPMGITDVKFEEAIQAAFQTWNTVARQLGASGTIPEFQYMGRLSALDRPAADLQDGRNVIGWIPGSGAGIAVTPCTILEETTDTEQDAITGDLILPLRRGNVVFGNIQPFPGPPGQYARGSIVDCGILLQTDPAKNSVERLAGVGWSFGAAALRYDIQSTITHEIGHALGLSHSTIGSTTAAVKTDDATMMVGPPAK